MRNFHIPGRSAVFATNGLCATSHPLASHVALNLLQQGGNAMDAAIGAAIVLGISEPQMTGIGGDCFALFTPPGQDRIVALNGSGRAPAGLTAAALRGDGHKVVPPGSAHAVTVPGAIDAFCRLSADWGALDLAQTLAPAIYYAETGLPVAPRTAFDWQLAEDKLQGHARDIFLFGGKAPQIGQVFRAPGQADVLRKVAKYGRAGFYEGEVADDMIAALRAAGGTHTADDFAKASSEYCDPVSGNYKGVDLFEHPPNGQGATAILLNNILSHFDLPDMDPFGTLRAHIEAEATKLAYDARNRFIADADYTTRLAHMLAPETAAQLAALIDTSKAMSSATKLTEAVHKDTIYITVVDRDRMAVSLIYSIFHSFGSGIASSKYGVLFQNRGAGFSLEAGHPNEAMGGKRPMHTIIPGILRKAGEYTMPFGVMGGAYQPAGHARFITNLVDYDLDLQTAIDAPRCFADTDSLKVEEGYSENVRQELADLGHQVEIPKVPLGGAQAIMIDEKQGTMIGASDPRKDGAALGY